MLKVNGLFKRRRASGAIIGGSFILLIMLSGYTFYILNNRMHNDYQEVVTDMGKEDVDRSHEDLNIIDIDPVEGENKISITVRNNGPKIIKLLYYGRGKLDQDNKIVEYVNMDITTVISEDDAYILPGERRENIEIPCDPGEKQLIQLITERGNIFVAQHPFILPGWDVIISDISDIIGRVIPSYESFEWAERVDELDVSGFEWMKSWAVFDSKDHVFRIKVLYYHTDPISLSPKTALFFHNLKNPSQSVELFIVDYDEIIDTISTFSSQDLFYQDTDSAIPFILTFAARTPGGNPTSPGGKLFSVGNTYNVILSIYEEPAGYAQAFPLITIEIVP
jgi:hypothetical protein